MSPPDDFVGQALVATGISARGPDPFPEWPSQELRDTVLAAAALDTPHASIARAIRGPMGKCITVDRLQEAFSHELDDACHQANTVVGGQLYQLAHQGNMKAISLWMRTKGGLVEAKRIEHTGRDSEAIEVKHKVDAAVTEVRSILSFFGRGIVECGHRAIWWTPNRLEPVNSKWG